MQNVILDSIEEAAAYVHEYTGVNIRVMPEYYINVVIAHALCKKFPSLGFRLEMPVRDLLYKYRIEKAIKSDELRDGGKFDIVLHTKKTRNVRHVIEVKRTLSKRQIKKEALRISALAHEKHGSKRLETGYIVAIRKLKDSTKSKTFEELLDNRIAWIKLVTGENMSVSARGHLFEPGEVGFQDNERLAIVVFCLKKNNV